RVALIAVLLATAATTACTSSTTQTSIRTAEEAADVRAFETAARVEAPASAAISAAAPPGAAATDDAALERPVGLRALEEAASGGDGRLGGGSHGIGGVVERARAEGKLPPPELMADVWQVPFAKPYAFDKAAMIMFSLRQQFPAAGMLDKMAEAMAFEAQ